MYPISVCQGLPTLYTQNITHSTEQQNRPKCNCGVKRVPNSQPVVTRATRGPATRGWRVRVVAGMGTGHHYVTRGLPVLIPKNSIQLSFYCAVVPAPRSRSIRMTSTCPLSDARWNGVWPSLPCAVGSAPCSRSIRMTSTCPWLDA